MTASNKDYILLSSGSYVRLPRPCSPEDAPAEKRATTIERVNNVWGSTAGAGSDFFHIYRKHRAHEMERLKQLDDDYEKEQEDREFQQQRIHLAQQDAERAQRRARKRKQLKEKKRQIQEVKKKAAPLNAFKDDGSFLATVLGTTTQQQQDSVQDKQTVCNDGTALTDS